MDKFEDLKFYDKKNLDGGLRRKGIFEDAQHKEFEIGEALDALMSD